MLGFKGECFLGVRMLQGFMPVMYRNSQVAVQWAALGGEVVITPAERLGSNLGSTFGCWDLR